MTAWIPIADPENRSLAGYFKLNQVFCYRDKTIFLIEYLEGQYHEVLAIRSNRRSICGKA